MPVSDKFGPQRYLPREFTVTFPALRYCSVVKFLVYQLVCINPLAYSPKKLNKMTICELEQSLQIYQSESNTRFLRSEENVGTLQETVSTIQQTLSTIQCQFSNLSTNVNIIVSHIQCVNKGKQALKTLEDSTMANALGSYRIQENKNLELRDPVLASFSHLRQSLVCKSNRMLNLIGS